MSDVPEQDPKMALAAIQAEFNESGEIPPLDILLPMFRLKGKPYTIDKEHYMFKPMFRVDHPRRVLWKTARQVGKCVAESDLHKLRKANGSPLTPEELRPGTQLLSMTSTFDVIPQAIRSVTSNGIRPVLEIKTRLGACFRITYNHPVLRADGYVWAEDLRPGDRLAALRSGGMFEDLPVDKTRLITTAYLLGDGSCRVARIPSLTTAASKTAIVSELKALFPAKEYTVLHKKVTTFMESLFPCTGLDAGRRFSRKILVGKRIPCVGV